MSVEGVAPLEFEKEVVEAELELGRLRRLVESGETALVTEAERLERRLEKLRREAYSNLSAYQRVQLSRHVERPFTSDYIAELIGDFQELHGDRVFGDDPAIIGGMGLFSGEPVVVVGHQRGRTTQERMYRNFGMPQPEGNRKAQRLFRFAEKFELPLLLFIDTQGAYPGLEAEARGQAESIASSLMTLCSLRTPIISTVIGEGGSGGALALGICDRLLMLENAIYSVISPEGCASILWGKEDPGRVAEYAATAADSLKITATALAEFKIVDEVVPEPSGGAHHDRTQAARLLSKALAKHLAELKALPIDELLTRRYDKFRKIGDLS